MLLREYDMISAWWLVMAFFAGAFTVLFVMSLGHMSKD